MAPKTDVDAAELVFRAICGIGWNLYLNLPELRMLCEGKNGQAGWPAWIDQVQTKVIDAYKTSGGPPDVWLSEIVPYVETITKGSALRKAPEIVEFLNRVLISNPDQYTQDIEHQLSSFNLRGHQLAGDMLRDAQWSTAAVAAHWNGVPLYSVSHAFVPKSASFYPVTDKLQHHITVKVEKFADDFKVNHALLSYLTLEFQFLHEYVSHALPIWSAAALEEVMLLSSTYDWYPRSAPPDGIRSFLVNKRRAKSPDKFADWRDRFKDFADVVGREKYARFILTLATIPDHQFSPSAKDNLLLKMSDLPLRNAQDHARCVKLMQVGQPDAAALEALRQHLPLPSH